MTDETLRVEYIPLDQARLWDENPKKHDLDAIQESIYRYGFQDPPKFDQALGGLVFGNGRTEALTQAKKAGKAPPAGIAIGQDGQWLVPVLFGNDLASRDAARAFAIDHNNLTMAGSHTAQEMARLWTAEGYSSILESLKLGSEMPITAWIPEPPEHKDAAPKVDQGLELAEAWGVETGSLWRIGDHRLLCGDATIAADVDRLMQGDQADLVYTDPPYGVSYIGESNEGAKEWERLPNDELRGQALQEWLTAAFRNFHRTTKANTALYCWHASKTQREFEGALNAAGYEVKQQLIWNKGMVLGRSDYHWSHEPLFYCKKSGQTTTWHGDRTGKTILGNRRTGLEKMTKETMTKILLALLDGSTVWEIDRDAVATYQHSTQKPTRLALSAIMNSSAVGGIVSDFFMGSGSTMVACENLGRACRGIDKVPGFVAIALQRMKDAFPSIAIERLKE